MIELALLLLGLGSTEFTVAVRDAATGKPVEGAFVVAREFTTVGQFHGSKTYCIRGDVAQASGPRLEMRLPGAGTDSFSGARAIEAFAYRPGFCIARTEDGRAASRALHGPSYGERARGLDPAAETRLDMRPSTQGAEDRLLYLGELALGLMCGEPRWSDRGREGIDRVAAAMLAEAQGLARSRYEKSLVEKIRTSLAAAREMKPDHDGIPSALGIVSLRQGGLVFPRDFIVGDPRLRASWDGGNNMVIAAMPAPAPQAARILAMPSGSQPGSAAVASSGAAVISSSLVVQPGIAVEASRLHPVIHCRHGAPMACDLNERDAQGATAIQDLVVALKPAEVKALLDAGADPSIAAKPSNVAPIETLVERLIRTQPGSGDAKNAFQILELLAAHPKVTLPRKLRDDLASDPATWTSVQHSAGRALLIEARPRLLALPARTDNSPACQPLGYVRDYGRVPIRLRYP